MRLATRTGMIATALAIGAILAPNAQAGLFSNGPDPKGAGQQEAQSFLRIYSHSAATPTVATPDRAAVARAEASIGAAFARIAQVNGRNIASTATPVASSHLICTPRSEPVFCRPISTPVVTTANPQGFQYGDAAIGAGLMAGLTLLGAAGALAVRRRTQPRHP
jgi:hypothetical protein